MQFSGMDGKEREGGRGSIESWRVKAELPQTFINVKKCKKQVCSCDLVEWEREGGREGG